MSAASAPRRPRLLIVGPVPPPIGGVETCTQAVLESHALDAFEVMHCDISKGRPKETQGRFDGGNFVWALRHFARMALALAKHAPDVSYVQVSGTFSGVMRDLVLVALARAGGGRVVAHQHAGEVAKQLARRGPAGALVRAGFMRAHRLLVLGASWRELFEAHDLGLPIAVCPSTFRRDFFAAAAAAPRGPREAGPLRLLFVGHVGRDKGMLDFVEAMRLLGERGVDATLTVVGPDQQPGETEAAKALAARLGVAERVRFAGMQTGDALLRQYRRHDAFVLPSHREGLPVVLFEAGVFALPVVTTPVGSIPDLVSDGENGLLVPPREPERLADAIASLARDAALATRLGEALKRDVRRYHPDRVAGIVADAAWTELRLAGRVTGARPGAEDARA